MARHALTRKPGLDNAEHHAQQQNNVWISGREQPDAIHGLLRLGDLIANLLGPANAVHPLETTWQPLAAPPA